MPTATFVSFTPTSGGPGTKVNIFTDAESITGLQLNNLPVLPETDFNTGGTFFRVPSNGSSGKVKLLYFGGSVTSTQTFMVTGTPISTTPRITSFNPLSGPVSTRVNIIGENLEGTTAATIGGRTCLLAAPPLSNLVIIDLPGNAQTGRIVLTGPGFSATSPVDFMVTLIGGGGGGGGGVSAPRIDNVFPLTGIAGDEITLTGIGFSTVSEAALSGRVAGFTLINDTSMRVRVPADTPSGKFSVTNPGGTASSIQTFTVTAQLGVPRIDNFSPLSGKEMDEITIVGLNLGAVDQVTFNGVTSSFTLMGNTTLRARVPRGATTGRIRARNAAGEGGSSIDFNVTTPVQRPQISNVSPLQGKVGDPVEITGQFFSGASQVLFGDKPAAFSESNGTLINASVPSGFSRGRITVTTPGGSVTSTQEFVVVAAPSTNAPQIDSVSSLTVNYLETLTFLGTKLFTEGEMISVTIGGTAQLITFVSALGNEIRIQVTPGTNPGLLELTTPRGKATFREPIQVPNNGLPFIFSFDPKMGAPGTDISVTGFNLEDTQHVRFLSTEAVIVSMELRQLKFKVPAVTPGNYSFGILTGRGEAFTGELFTVLTAPPTNVNLGFSSGTEQPLPEPDPLVSNEEAPDFDGADSFGRVRLISGQSKSFNLIAKRPDFLPDTVTVKLNPLPPNGLRIIFPTTVQANVPFKVKVETDPTLPPQDDLIFNFSGESSRDPGVGYAPFTLAVNVVAPVEYIVPQQVNVLSGGSVEFNVTVIRRRFSGMADFNFPDVATHGITFTKTLVSTTANPSSDRGGIREKYKVKFVSDRRHVPTGLFDIAFMTTANGVAIKAPAKFKLHLIEPNLSVERPLERNIKPGKSDNFQYNFVPQDFRGSLKVDVEFVNLSNENKGKITTNAPIIHTVNSNDQVLGTLEVRVDPAAKEEDVNLILKLFTDLNEEVGRTVTLVVRIANSGVEFVTDYDDFSVYPNLTAKINVDFKRARNYTKDFIFKVTSFDSGLSITFNGPERVPPASKGKSVNITPIQGYTEGDANVRLEPLDPDTNRPVGDPVILIVRKRDQKTLLRWDSGRYSIPFVGGSCTAALSFRSPFEIIGDILNVPLGPNELFQGTVFIRDRNKSITEASPQFFVYEKGKPLPITIASAFFNNKDRRRFEFEIVDSTLPTTGDEIFELVGLFQGTVLGPVENAFVEVVVPLIYLGREGTTPPPPITKRVTTQRTTTTTPNTKLRGQ